MMGDKNRTQGRHGRGTVGRDSAAARGLSHDAIKLLKTQDKGYLRTSGERIRREIERLEREVELQKGMNESLGVKTQQKNEEEDDDEFDGFDSDLDVPDFSAPPKPKSRKVVFADDRGEQQTMKKKRVQDDDSMDEDEDDDEEPSTATRKTPKQLAAERQKLVEVRRARKLRKRAAEARENKLVALRKQFAEIEAAEREVDWQRSKMDNSVGGTNKNGIKWKIRERKR